MFQNILVAIDTDKPDCPALDRAVALAKQYDSKIKLVDNARGFSWPARFALQNTDHLFELLIKEKQEKLEAVANPIREQGIPVTTKVVTGRFSIEIVKEVLRDGHDLAMRTSKGLRSRRSGTWGNTSRSLLRQCPCALWLVKPEHRGIERQVLASIDATPHDEDHRILNEKILTHAASVSTHDQCRFSVVHVWNIFAEEVLRNHMNEEEYAEMTESTRADLQKHIDEILAPYGFSANDERVHLLHGDATKLIPRMTMDQETDLIVMGTVARTGISGMLMGNTAEIILNRVDCSVLALKPDGFVCPIAVD